MINNIPFTEGFNPLPSNIFMSPPSGTPIYGSFAEPTPLMPHDYEILDMQPKQEGWPRLERLIGDEPIICPILYDEIGSGAEYCRCSTCKNGFGAAALAEALKKSYTCPMCRCIWKDQTVYVNGLAPLTVAVARPKESFWVLLKRAFCWRHSN